MRRVTGLNFDFSSPSVISSGLLTSPSMVIFHSSGSLASSGIWPLLRMKNFGGRRGVVVEQMLRRLRHQRAVAEQHELVVLAGEFQILRPLRRGRRRRRRGRALAPAPPGSARPACWPRTEWRRRPPRPSPRGPRRRESRGGRRRSCGRTPRRRRAPGLARKARRSSARFCSGIVASLPFRRCPSIAALIVSLGSAIPGIQDRECTSAVIVPERNDQLGRFLVVRLRKQTVSSAKVLGFEIEDDHAPDGSGRCRRDCRWALCSTADARSPQKRRAVQPQSVTAGTTYVRHTDEYGPHSHPHPGAEALVSRRRHRGDAGRATSTNRSRNPARALSR